jgi:hypothetical protein
LFGRVLSEAAVGPVGVVVLDVVAKERLELLAVPDEGAVAELAACGVDPAFCVGVRDLRIWRRADDRRAVAGKDVAERAVDLSSAVADPSLVCQQRRNTP